MANLLPADVGPLNSGPEEMPDATTGATAPGDNSTAGEMELGDFPVSVTEGRAVGSIASLSLSLPLKQKQRMAMVRVWCFFGTALQPHSKMIFSYNFTVICRGYLLPHKYLHLYSPDHRTTMIVLFLTRFMRHFLVWRTPSHGAVPRHASVRSECRDMSLPFRCWAC